MVVEHQVVFCSGELRLRGTLTTPAGPGPFACVLLLVGSGRVDRDSNQKFFALNVMNVLAGHLAEKGIASLRYDKRGVGASEGDFWTTGFYDNVTDAEAAVNFVSERHDVRGSKIFVLGHSEGAYIAARLVARIPMLAGAVLLAGGARPGEDELRWQGLRVAETLTGPTAFMARLMRIDLAGRQAKQLHKVKRSMRDTYRVGLLTKVNAKWCREFLAYDPREDLARIAVPVLGLIGEKDIQVDPGNLERMRELILAPFDSHLVSDLTHLLREDQGPPGIGTYRKQAKRPLDPRVSELIVEWLERRIAENGC